MHYVLFLVVFIVPLATRAASKDEIKEAQVSIRALLAHLTPGSSKLPPAGTENFEIQGCEKHKIDWSEVILGQKKPVIDYTFSENCDIEGSINPVFARPFPTSLKLRNLKHFNHIDTQNLITADLQVKPLLNIEMRSGILSGQKGLVKFEADYKVRINPSEQKKLDANEGGEIRISEIYGKKVSIKEKIKIQ